MALRFIDSFDDRDSGYRTGKWTSCPGSILSGQGRGGGNAYDPSGSATKTIDDQSTWIVGFAFYLTNSSQTGSLISFLDSDGAYQISSSYNSGTVKVMSGPLGATLGESTATLTLNAWAYFEIKVVLHDTTGSVEARLNGTSILTLTDIDTQTTAIASARTISFPDLAYFKMDDVYVCDGSGTNNKDFLGDSYITCIFPDGDGSPASANWVSSGGGASTWANVDTNPPVDTPYNLDDGSALPVTDIWATQDVTIADSLYGIQVNCLAKAVDSDTEVWMHNICRSGGTEYDSASYQLSTSYVYKMNIWEQDPKTSINWTATTLSAAEFGYERETPPA